MYLGHWMPRIIEVKVTSFKVLLHSLPFIRLILSTIHTYIENWPKEYKAKQTLKHSSASIQYCLVHTENLYILTCSPSVCPVLVISQSELFLESSNPSRLEDMPAASRSYSVTFVGTFAVAL